LAHVVEYVVRANANSKLPPPHWSWSIYSRVNFLHLMANPLWSEDFPSDTFQWVPRSRRWSKQAGNCSVFCSTFSLATWRYSDNPMKMSAWVVATRQMAFNHRHCLCMSGLQCWRVTIRLRWLFFYYQKMPFPWAQASLLSITGLPSPAAFR